MGKSEKLELRIEPELLALVKESAGDVPVSVWVRRAIEQRLARTTAPEDLARVREAVKAIPAGVAPEWVEPPPLPATATEVPQEAEGLPPFRCPTAGCTWKGASSPNATCSRHGNKVIAR